MDTERFHRYSLMITVTLMLYLLLNANQPYDGWDLVFSLMGAGFGIACLWQETADGALFRLMAGFLGSIGIVNAVISLISLLPIEHALLFNMYAFLDLKPVGVTYLFLFTLGGTVVLLIAKALFAGRTAPSQ